MRKAIRTAFSIYSAIPVKNGEWTGDGMAYVLPAMPLIGVVIGAVYVILLLLMDALHMGFLFRGCVLTAVPILITGGIHLDGFMDVSDAVHSYGTREERLAIMKDPHVGAFAIMDTCLYLVVYAGVCSELTSGLMPAAFFVFVLSRALSALAAATFPKAKKNGMLHSVAEQVPGRAVGMIGAEVLASILLALILGAFAGVFATALLMVLAAVLMYVIYFFVMLGLFDGTTGDLAGWFLQLTELVMILVLVVVSRM